MNGQIVVGEKITPEEKEIIIDDDLIVILEDGQFQNATGVYWANGTAVVPEFGAITMVVLATAVIGTILITRGRLA
jgi:predicted secreted protein with PEFG-CTERM motif